MRVDDELLMAFADGELDAEQGAAVERAVAADPALAARLAQHRKLQGSLRAAFDGVLSEPVPERLLQALQSNASSTPTSRSPAVRGQAARAHPRGGLRQWLDRQRARLPGGWAWPQVSAVAASLAIGGVIGMLAMNSRDAGLIGNRSGQLLARGALTAALDSQPSGATGTAIQLNASFRDKAGEYCRTFVISDAGSMAGVACHRGDDWRVDVLSATGPAQGGGFRQAGSELPAAVLGRVTEQIEGEPLDAAAEKLALERHWR
ncbi:MAG TPA: hypothetical protein VMI92_02510 [Steroidobacteraceae bacterium]|nr:hypothetical protein [Steroidobacteraceae bacterium]